MGRKDGVTFFQMQKPLIVFNVDELQQSTEMLRGKAFLPHQGCWTSHFWQHSHFQYFFFVLHPAQSFHMTSVPLILYIGFHFR